MFALIRTTTSVVLLLLTHKEEKGANGGRFSQLLPGTSIHPTQQLACLLYVARPTTQHSRRRRRQQPCPVRAASRRAAVRPTPCGKAAVSGGAAACMLALSGSSLLLRAEFHTGAGDQWPQQHCRKGMKKILYRKTNRVTLIGYSSLKYSEWIHFIHYFILYLQLLLLIEQAIIESWLVNLITYHLGNSSQLHTYFIFMQILILSHSITFLIGFK